MLRGRYFRLQEQEENPTAVLHALKTYDWNIRSQKSQKYFVDTSSSSSNNSVSDESGISLDDNQRTADCSETTNAVCEHSQVAKQPSASAVDEGNTACTNVSSTLPWHYVMFFFIFYLCATIMFGE